MPITPLVTVNVLPHVSITKVRMSIPLRRPTGLDALLVEFAFIKHYKIGKLIEINANFL